MPQPLPSVDLDHVLAEARETFHHFRDARIFLTGGTGFFGHWLLESLLHADRTLHLNLRITALTRNPAGFRARSPHLANQSAVSLLEGDAKSFAFPEGDYTHILHAATDSTGAQAHLTETELATSILAGTQRVLDFAAHLTGQSAAHGKAVRLLYVSSGAVYGRNITTVPRISETFPLPPTPQPDANYDAAKRASELLCMKAASPALHLSIARCFAFTGPHLPLDAHFAIGNFIGDALAGRRIHIKGDGTPLRSFLYMSDLAVWLWTILAVAPQGAVYNVGSDEAVSIAELAHTVAHTLRPGLPVQIDGIADPDKTAATYVPDIRRLAAELNLTPTVPLAEAIRRTAAWHRAQGSA